MQVVRIVEIIKQMNARFYKKKLLESLSVFFVFFSETSAKDR